MIIINGEQTANLLSTSEVLEIIEHAMVRTSTGDISAPIRYGMPVSGGNGMIGFMTGSMDSPACSGVKLVSLFPNNKDTEYSSHLGLYILYENKHGVPLAVIDGAVLTARRTAAATAIASKHLARQDSKTLTLLGTGEQALMHLDILPYVIPFEEIRIWGRDYTKAKSIVEKHSTQDFRCKLIAIEDLNDATSQADVICTLTSSTDAILEAGLITAGMHINLVGSSFPNKTEISPEGLAKGKYFVDHRDSVAALGGEYKLALDQGIITPGHIQAEIGDIISGSKTGRTSTTDITIYKSIGVCTQDIAVAYGIYKAASAEKCGQEVQF